jgi:hypothetical protein
MRTLWSTLILMNACDSNTKNVSPSDSGDSVACDDRDAELPTSDFFTDISEASGIQLGNFDPDPPESIPINDHSRLAFADLNGDGFDDIVMHSLYPNPAAGIPFEHLVFLNRGDGTFSDHSDASGLRDIQAGFYAFADVDNDGDQDAFAGLDLPNLTGHQSTILLNDGDGVFTELAGAGVAASQPTAATAVFADFNGDGSVDLFVGNGHTSYGARDLLYWGNGDGSFTVDTAALVGVTSQPSNGSVACDYDNDGDMDIFVATYGVSVEHGHNQLWQNDGGSFTNVASAAGAAAQGTGNYFIAQTGYGEELEPDVSGSDWVGSNAFGVDCGDVDNDGDLDFWVTAISHPVAGDYSRKWSDPSQLLLNQGDGTFVNGFLEAEIPFNEGDIDAAMVDFDNDGRLDLSVTRDPKYEGGYSEAQQFAWFGLMWQREGHNFAPVGLDSGINTDAVTGLEEGRKKQMKGGQNHAWADIDHDGDLDLLVGGRDQGGGRPNYLYQNEIGSDNRWVAVKLIGDGDSVHTDAFGARIIYEWGDDRIVREQHGSRGTYNSEDSRWMHIGLGGRDCSADITVRWPDGVEASFEFADIGTERFVSIEYPNTLHH